MKHSELMEIGRLSGLLRAVMIADGHSQMYRESNFELSMALSSVAAFILMEAGYTSVPREGGGYDYVPIAAAK